MLIVAFLSHNVSSDLNEEGSFDEAVKGCDGVFHVAASMEFNVVEKENIEAHVQANIIDPAIRGTLNLLKSCLNSNSVKRVVFTSSISTITAKDCNGKWKPIVDESCQIKTEQVVKTQASGWVYALSKHLTEEAAFKFAKENGIDLVSVITTTVAGPFFTASVPSSVKVLLSPITGEPEFFNILSAVNARIGSIALVHIEDICSAHIFLMEHSKAEGRYICSSQSCPTSMLVNLLAKEYSYSNKRRISEKNYDEIPSEISSKKLKDLGFCYKLQTNRDKKNSVMERMQRGAFKGIPKDFKKEDNYARYSIQVRRSENLTRGSENLTREMELHAR
ncbi:hypothetical protein Fmac_019139 [Flemingia macrophylla]|uniref:NAD-dependent epimerase/dehydratase domain-containing protein n=1 Tax=Flemingia macrophylla TaxID=520843 RepID=A0ABD1M6Y7_9FABA